ncbi:MAG: hypothetical protein HUK20_09255 [Fibrobacter sp.]|nr:hypothetical protein [Fibrobacter sp.]
MNVKIKITFGIIFVAVAGCAAYYINNMMGTSAAVEKYNRQVENRYASLKIGKFTDDRDGHKYATIRIGNQNWMAENMRWDIPKGSFCYDDKSENCQADGNLYSWEVAQRACPAGWHLSTDKDWNVLEEFIKEDNKGDASVARKLLLKMRKESLCAGNVLNFNGDKVDFTVDGKKYEAEPCRIHYDAVDKYGFGASLSGIATYAFGERKWNAEKIGFWTDAEIDKDVAVSRILSRESGYIQRIGDMPKEAHLAVRCVQNDENEPVSVQKLDTLSAKQPTPHTVPDIPETVQVNESTEETFSQELFEKGKEAGKNIIRKTLEKTEEKVIQGIDGF